LDTLALGTRLLLLATPAWTINIIFSLDSVITAVGMVDTL